jgi:predicted DNA-binding protein YlxM (UPF0122 family)
MLSDTTIALLTEKQNMIKDSIDRTSLTIEDYNQRIQAMTDERTRLLASKATLTQQLADITADLEE